MSRKWIGSPPVVLDPEYSAHVSGGHRAQEAVQLLKEFYNGENPYAPNPKVKGVKLKKDSPPAEPNLTSQ